MTFHDNSDFAPMVRVGETGKEVEMEEVSRGEEFIQAGVLLAALGGAEAS